ncbi:uncharacterized protein LOC141908816 [Tubulanus polymorphus]|uniref:uncharacterized protein LOC141908816 n=1 Tax=Tubulanus polymorphus TaxID=672921 RepID=UPI003DA50988
MNDFILCSLSIVILLGCISGTESIRCHNMVCTGNVDWWDKKCTKLKSPNQILGECEDGKWCAKSEGADKFGKRLSIHECSFSCNQWDKFHYNDVYMEQYCCRTEMCNGSDRPSGKIILLPLFTVLYAFAS